MAKATDTAAAGKGCMGAGRGPEPTCWCVMVVLEAVLTQSMQATDSRLASIQRLSTVCENRLPFFTAYVLFELEPKINEFPVEFSDRPEVFGPDGIDVRVGNAVII